MAVKGLRFRKKDGAAAAIESAAAVLEVLRLTKVDLTVAEELLAKAREAAKDGSSDAVTLANRAEALATRLEERHRGAKKALNDALAMVKKAKEMGLDPAELELAIEQARRIVREGTVEDGVAIPNYLQARATLDIAMNAHREAIDEGTAVGNEVFTAEVALDALKDANGSLDHDAFDRNVMKGIRALVENAKLLAGKHRLKEAKAVALAAQKDAARALEDYKAAIAALRAAEAVLGDLRAEGAIAVGPGRKLAEGQALLREARLAEARAVLEEVTGEVGRLGEVYRRTTESVTKMEDGISAMLKSGGVPEEAQHAVQTARRALEEGRYGRAEELLQEARKAMSRRMAVRERLQRSIQETKEQVGALRASGSDFANDVEEMVLRAEKEFENGDLTSSSEDLKIATLLMGKAGPAAHRAEAPKVPNP